MRINHNLASLNTYRQLTSNTISGSKSLEKLSSGLRINRAGDDAAGLAISEKMRGQIRGLDQAGRNAQDAISLIQTAEGALSETHSILQRMRELAIQSANDTNTAADRAEMQKEIEQLKAEINRVADTTEFNTQKLLNGSLGAVGNSSAAANVDVVSVTGLKVGAYTVNIGTSASQATKSATAVVSAAAIVSAVGTGPLKINGVTIDVTGVTDLNSLKTAVNAVHDQTGVQLTSAAGAAIVLTADDYGSAGAIDLSGSDAKWLVTDVFGAAALTAGVDAVATITDADAVSQTITAVGRAAIYRGAELTIKGAAAATATINVTTSGASLQIGANKDQAMLVDVNEMSTITLGDATVGLVKDINVQTQAGGNDAIDTIDKAIAQVSSERSKLGAFQNRLEHTINNLGTSSENLTASESRIRDVDMAKEMMEFTKNNILSQAATAMLAQANQQPQGVLQLLR